MDRPVCRQSVHARCVVGRSPGRGCHIHSGDMGGSERDELSRRTRWRTACCPESLSPSVIGTSTTVGAFVAALLMVLGINVMRTRSPLPEDTSIGVLFVGFLALAVVVLSAQSGSYTGDLNDFLFGTITGIDNGDLVRQAIAAGLSVVGVVVFHRAFLCADLRRGPGPDGRGANPSGPRGAPRPRGGFDSCVVRNRRESLGNSRSWWHRLRRRACWFVACR